MRQYTIAKTLALFLGVLSVIARSLPERRSEINVRTPGGTHFDISTPSHLQLLSFSFALIIVTITHRQYQMSAIPNSASRNWAMSWYVSEGVLDGKIHTATYSMSQNTTFPKRDTTPEKPRDFRGHQCLTTCGQFKGPPLLDDCKRLFKTLQSKKKTFTVGPGKSPSLPQDTKPTDARDRSSCYAQKYRLCSHF